MNFGGLVPLLGVELPGSGKVTELDDEQREKLAAQFAPFLAGAAETLKKLGIGDDSPMVHLLKGDLEGEGHYVGFGQHGGNFVLLSDEIKGEEGSKGRGIVWFEGDQYFTVSSTYQNPDGSGGCNYKVEIPFDRSDVRVDFYGQE